MTRLHLLGMIMVTTWLPLTATAKPPQAEDPLAAGSLLSDGMVRGLIKRGAHDMSRMLNLDDRQREQLGQTLLDRWVPFVQKHRREMAPLMSRMLEAQMDPDLPSTEEAGDWAKKVLPMYDLITEELQRSNQDVSRILTPAQREQFKNHTDQMDTGMRMFKVELDKMAGGQLDQTLWAMERRNHEMARRRRREERERQRERELVESLGSSRALFVDQWSEHVSGFIRMFQLDESQKQAAFSILEDVRKRAEQYVRNRRDDIHAVQRSLKDAEPGEREQVLVRQAAVVRPLNDLFGELQSRLDRIPTKAQRRQATKGISTKPAAGT